MDAAQFFLQFNLLSLVLLFIVTALHIRHNYAGSLPSRLMSLFLFSVFYATLIPNLILTGTIFYFPHLHRTGTILGLIAAPLMYLITTLAMTGKKLKWIDTLHLLPAVLYIVNYFPFFFMGTAEKISLLKGLTAYEAIYSHSEGWLLNGKFIYDFRIIQVLFYLVITVRKMITHKQELEQWKDEEFNWRPVLLQLLMFISFYLLPFLVRTGHWLGKTEVDTMQVSFAVANLLLSVFFLSNPALLYGFRVMKSPETPKAKLDVPGRAVMVEAELPGVMNDQASERVNRRIARIQEHLNETRSFLNPEFGLTTLEKEIGISGKLIGQTIKEGTGQNFSAYINDLRISYVLEQFQADPRWKNYTVETLASSVGYRSPTSFYNNFKEKTGKTPREFIENLG